MTLVVYSCRLGTRAAKAHAYELLDVTRETADAEGSFGAVWAPSWAILQPVLEERRLQRRGFFGPDREAALEEARARELEAWRAYVPAYLAEMRASYRRHREAWARLLARERVVLACHCQAPERCHRTVLATMILPRLGATYAGELASRRDGVHVEMVEVAA